MKLRESYTYDELSLGEIMLRFDPGEGRIRTARWFRVWEGGGEYNGVLALRKCFGMKTALCTALVDDERGHLLECFIIRGWPPTSFMASRPRHRTHRAQRARCHRVRVRCPRRYRRVRSRGHGSQPT